MKPLAITFLTLLTATLLASAQKAPSNLPTDTEFSRDVPYAKNAHERQKLDIAYFKDGKPRPLLIWIHGGAFMTGDKAENHAIWPELMSSGYAVATINYRLSGDAKWPAIGLIVSMSASGAYHGQRHNPSAHSRANRLSRVVRQFCRHRIAIAPTRE